MEQMSARQTWPLACRQYGQASSQLGKYVQQLPIVSRTDMPIEALQQAVQSARPAVANRSIGSNAAARGSIIPA
jgi:hypothetical protein